MKLLLDLRPLGMGSRNRGIGSYVAGLAQGLISLNLPWELWGLTLVDQSQDNLPASFKIHPVRRQHTGWKLSSWLEEAAKLPGEVNRIAPSIYHHTSQFIPSRLPHPTVISAYDAIPVLFPKGVSRNEKLIFLAGYWGMHAADHLVTISHSSQNDIGRIFRLPSERFTAAYIGISDGLKPFPSDSSESWALLQRLKISKPFVLYVGGGEPRKGMPFLLEAFSRASSTWHELQLVVAGSLHFHQQTRISSAQMGLAERVIFTDRITETELATLYQNAFAYLHPAEYEGFGLPPLEAMRLRCPVISRYNSSLPESLGDAAAFLPEDTPAAMAKLILQLHEDPKWRQVLGDQGVTHATSFTWSKCAAEMVEVYQKILLSYQQGGQR